MKLNSSFFITFLILILIFISTSLAQDFDIKPYLKKIESGQKDEVIQILPSLKRDYPDDPSLIFLDGLLTEDGEKAFQIYSALVERYPKSKYADAAVYRIYTYFIAVEKPDKAELYLKKLKTDYAGSPYIKLTERAAFTEIEREPVSKEINKTDLGNKTKSTQKDFKFTIQAGAFTSKDNALKLKTDFEKAGYSSQLVQKTVGGSLFHVVNVGKFVSEDEAKSFLNVINLKFKLQGWVVKLD